MITVGLVGAHRVGKTTICEMLEEQGFLFFRSDVSATFERLGIAVTEVKNMDQRLMIQEEVIKDYNDQLIGFKLKHLITDDTVLITDRTPLDMAMYTVADVLGKTEVDFNRFDAYIQRCLDETEKVTRLIQIQPGIPLVEAEGKAALNPTYIEHLNWIMLGLLNDRPQLLAKSTVLAREMTDLEGRLFVVNNIIKAAHHD